MDDVRALAIEYGKVVIEEVRRRLPKPVGRKQVSAISGNVVTFGDGTKGIRGKGVPIAVGDYATVVNNSLDPDRPTYTVVATEDIASVSVPIGGELSFTHNYVPTSPVENASGTTLAPVYPTSPDQRMPFALPTGRWDVEVETLAGMSRNVASGGWILNNQIIGSGGGYLGDEFFGNYPGYMDTGWVKRKAEGLLTGAYQVQLHFRSAYTDGTTRVHHTHTYVRARRVG